MKISDLVQSPKSSILGSASHPLGTTFSIRTNLRVRKYIERYRSRKAKQNIFISRLNAQIVRSIISKKLQ